MKCNEFKKSLSLLARLELEEPERSFSERHARECSDCGRVLRETRALELTVRQAAAADPALAAPALEGFEDRFMERWRQQRMADALAPVRPRLASWRLAFGFSLALNLCVAGVFLIILFTPGVRERLAARATQVRTLPAGLPSEARMLSVFHEMETFYGRRLNWVSESGGQMAMGIISDPAEVPAGAQAREPLVALVYWLDADGAPKGDKPPSPVVIMTRSGREIRQRVPFGPGHAPVEIAVESFRSRRGGFAIQTEVRPMENASRPNESVSSLAAAVSLAPGKPTKLGEVRLGNRLYNTFLAVQVLDGVAGHDTDS